MVAAWESTASKSPLQIEAKWGMNPDALPAIPVGAHGLVVIDCDRKNGVDGVTAFQTLCAQYSIDLSGAFAVESPSSGLHYYFRTDVRYGNSRGSLPEGIDVRGVGGYVIAPGATLSDGRSYKLKGSWDAIPALPDALAAFLKRKDVSETPSLPTAVADAPRAFTFETPDARKAFNDECAAVAAAKPGTRNATLNKAAKCLGEFVGAGHLEHSKAEQGLWEATAQNGTFEYAEGETTTRATIKSGLDAGIQEPRPVWIQAEPWISQMVAKWIEADQAKQSTLEGFIESIKSPFEYECAPLTYLIDGFIPEACITMLSGDAGSGKSSIVMKIADAISKGSPIFWGAAKPARRVLYLDKDNALPIVRERMTRLHIRPNSNFKYWGGHLGEDAPNRIFSDEGLLTWINKAEPKPLIVIDSQIAFQDGRESDSNDIRAFYNPLRRLTYLGVTVIVLHHTGKGETTKEFRGSNDIKASVDVGFTVSNAGVTVLTKLSLTAFKARVSVHGELAFNYVDGDFAPQNLIEAKNDNLTQLLRTNPGITKSDFEKMAMEARFSRSDVRNFIDTGIGFGNILTRKGERNAQLLYLPESIALAQV